MFNTSQLTGSRNGHASFLAAVHFFKICWHDFCHLLFPDDKGTFHSQISGCVFSSAFCSASVNGRFVPSNSTLINLYGWNGEAEFKGAICASVSPGAGFGAHTAQSQPGRGGGGTHVSMATLFVVVVAFVVVVVAASGAGGVVVAAASDIFLFVRWCDWILFGRSNSSSPSSLLDSLSHSLLSLLSLSLLSLSLSLSLFRYIYIFSVYIFCVIRAKCVLCRRLNQSTRN